MKQIPLLMLTAINTVGFLFLGNKFLDVKKDNNFLLSLIEHQREKQVEDLEKYFAISSASVVERPVGEAGSWRDVQGEVHDTVAQVFAQITQVDILMPFKTPSPNGACGSAFSIGDGYFVTNAHVVDQAQAVWIQMPSLGKRIIDVCVVGISPERDLALLKVVDSAMCMIEQELGHIPSLQLGDSDLVRRADCIMALGYPLGQQSLKSTTGVISGREQHLIQMSAAINPGSSGGPSLDMYGNVIGINTSGYTEAQNIGYIIPINDLKNILAELQEPTEDGLTRIVRKPFLGVLMNNATEALAESQGNPVPAGAYIVEIVNNSPLAKAGVQKGDMLYQIDGYNIDRFGEMNVPWSEDKISVIDYVLQLKLDQDVDLITYRSGERMHLQVKFEHTEQPPIHRIYPGYEEIDYEIFGGMVVCELSINHIQMLSKLAPGLAKYADLNEQTEPVLVVTHVFQDSQLHRSRCMCLGATLEEINGVRVRTLADFRMAISTLASDKFFTIKAYDHTLRFSEEVLVVLRMDGVIEELPKLARTFRFGLSPVVKELVNQRKELAAMTTTATVA